MSPQANQHQQSRVTSREQAVKDGSRLLEEVLAKEPSSRFGIIDAGLKKRILEIEEVLPDGMKGQGLRLAKRALMTLNRKPELSDCPPADFVRCVIEAAELGLAIDGKLAYVVRYKDAWQMQPDYKGIIAVAKRCKQIEDCYARIVCENDQFIHGQEDGKCYLKHTWALADRGEVIGAYAIVTIPEAGWRYELMDRAELNHVQQIAPSKKGPWLSWPDEMRKKTVIRRCLKTYCDDPAVIRAVELADQEYEVEPEPPPMIRETGRQSLRTNGTRPAPRPPEVRETEQDHPPEDYSPPPDTNGTQREIGDEPPEEGEDQALDSDLVNLSADMVASRTQEQFRNVGTRLENIRQRMGEARYASFLQEFQRLYTAAFPAKKPAKERATF